MLGVDLALGLAIALGLYMAYAIGANDVANAMGTSVGSRALTLRQAIMIAAVFEFLGAFLAGGDVTKTVRSGILNMDVVAAEPDLVMYGMLASLTGAATWLIAASRMGWPVSTTHSIVGTIAGFGSVCFGVAGVNWDVIFEITGSWLISPLLSGTAAFVLFSLIQRTILDTEDPLAQLRRWGGVHIFAVVSVITLVTLYKGLTNLNVDLGLAASAGTAVGLGAVVAAIGTFFIRRIRVDPEADRSFRFATAERMFAVLMVLTSCAVAFAHGSNDVANAIGPLAAALDISQTGQVAAEAPVPPLLLLVGAGGIVLGLVMMGSRVMATIGERLTQLTPSRGYAAQFAAAVVILLASRMGWPVSTTHVLVGAVLGVGLARGLGALDYRVVGTIVVSWVVTLPAGAGLAIFFFYFYKGLLTSLGGS